MRLVKLAASAIAVAGNQLEFNQLHTMSENDDISRNVDRQTALESAIFSAVCGISTLFSVALNLDESHSELVNHAASVFAFDLTQLISDK